MSNDNDGDFTPTEVAQAHFELHGEDRLELVNTMLEKWEWEHGDFLVTCVYAPENEETRIFYIVAFKGSEVMRCKNRSAITSFFEIMEKVLILEERCAELEVELEKERSISFIKKLFR
jgi:hypothetical protein